jgi:hypothetical protein
MIPPTRMRGLARGEIRCANMNAQPVADARSVSEMPAGRVPGSRKEPARQRTENVATKTPAKPESYCFSERLKKAPRARSYRTRSTLQRTRDAPWACAVFRVTVANWPGSTPQKRRTKRQSQRERTPSSAAEIPSGRISAQEISAADLNSIDYA